jgi:hypothetical protein
MNFYVGLNLVKAAEMTLLGTTWVCTVQMVTGMLVMANPGVTGAALFIVQVKIPVLTKKTFFFS